MRIAIGYDGSESSKDAILALGRAGLPNDTEARVVSVADVWPVVPESSDNHASLASNLHQALAVKQARALAAQARAEAESHASEGAQLVRSEFPTWKVSDTVYAGSPALALIGPTEEQPDLIVVGERGRSALQRLVLGSVSQSVLTHALCSVRISRRTNIAATGIQAPVRIIIGVDGSKEAALAVSAVAGRTWPASTEVKVIAAMDLKFWSFLANPTAAAWAAAWSPNDLRDEDGGSWASHAVEAVAEELRSTGLSVTASVEEGDPKHVLVQEAEKWSADCIFVGARGHSGMKRILLGSVSASVAARAHCSVEVVRQEH